jgi:hypothetical protein
MDTWFNASGGGGGQKITIDGSVLKDMKLTAKYQWVADKDTLFAGTENTKIYASYKGKIHMITSSRKHYRLESNGWVRDIDAPDGGAQAYITALEHGEYLYYLFANAVYRFDGTAFTKVLDIPSKESDSLYGTSYLYRRIPAIVDNKMYLFFQTRTGSNSYTYYTYCGYIDLDTLEWIDIAALPYPGGALLGVIDGVLYAIGGYNNSNRTGNIYKLNTNTNSWTQITGSNMSLSTTDSYVVSNDDKLYIPAFGSGLISFDGEKIEIIISLDEHLSNPTLVLNGGKLHLFGQYSYSQNYVGGFSFDGLHQVLEKVLCLEG